MSDVTVKQIRAFVLIAQTKSFKVAALRLSVSQPTLSMLIKQIEDALGTPLFHRTTRRVTLTDEAKSFLPIAESLLENFDSVMSNQRASGLERQRRVGVSFAVSSLSDLVLADALKEFAENYRLVKTKIFSDISHAVWQQVLLGEADFGFVSAWEKDPRLSFTPVVRDRFGVVGPRGHPLFENDDAIEWSELKNYDMISWDKNGGVARCLRDIGDIPEHVFQGRYESAQWPTIQSLIEKGLGVAVIPSLVLKPNNPSTLAFRALRSPIAEREVFLVTRSDRPLSKVAHRLKEIILSRLRRALADDPLIECVGPRTVPARQKSDEIV